MTDIPNTSPQLPAFPESVLNPSKRGRTRVKLLAGLVVLALLAATAVLVPVDFTSEGGGNFRTGTVTTQDVEETYTNVATIEPVTQASVGFPVDGTVNSIDVEVGDQVNAGDSLATLDTEELEESLRAEQATLAEAELVLAIALDGDDPSSVIGGSAFEVSGEETASALLAVYTPEETATIMLAAVSNDDIAAAQQAVLDAQQAVDAAIADAATALESAILICDAVETDVTPIVDPDDPSAPITIPTDTIEACKTALNEVVAAQQVVNDAQAGLATASAALDDLLAQWADELAEESTSTTTPDTTVPDTTVPGTTPDITVPDTTPDEPPGGGGQPGGGEQPGGGGSAPSTGGAVAESPSSEDLIAYQSSVDAAALQVQVAEQALAQASVVTPISGTVTEVNIEQGAEVTGASETQTIVVEGPGGYEATLMVSINDISEIEVGQQATLLADGSSEPINGEVVLISAVPASSGTTTSYQVSVSLDGDSSTMRNGNIGNVAIATGVAGSVLSVPTSAVTLNGTTHSVEVVEAGGTVSSVTVEIGVVGETWTEIIGGDLSVGQEVILADLDEPLPGSATEVSETTEFVFPGGGGALPAFG